MKPTVQQPVGGPIALTTQDLRSPFAAEGTAGIQANDLIGRKLVRDSVNMAALISDMKADLETAVETNAPALASINALPWQRP